MWASCYPSATRKPRMQRLKHHRVRCNDTGFGEDRREHGVLGPARGRGGIYQVAFRLVELEARNLQPAATDEWGKQSNIEKEEYPP